jgi:hypothetical protein
LEISPAARVVAPDLTMSNGAALPEPEEKLRALEQQIADWLREYPYETTTGAGKAYSASVYARYLLQRLQTELAALRAARVPAPQEKCICPVEHCEDCPSYSPPRRPQACSTCQGRGWIAKGETRDFGHGLGAGGAWTGPCPDCRPPEA